MKLSILNQAPITEGETASNALENAIELAKQCEELGYHRYWIAEHHDLFGLACPNPDVMLGAIGSRTEKIRIGAGAVLLPYYKPFRVAETYNLLATLFPDRVDLGLGRAPGGSAEVSLALADNYLKQVKHYSDDIDDLLKFLHDGHTKDEPNGKISPTPVPDAPPETWLLGTSEKSAFLAADKGMDYAFGHFMTDKNGPEIVQQYRNRYSEINTSKGNVIIAISVICADTEDEANRLAMSPFLWKIRQEKQMDDHHVPSLETTRHYPFSDEERDKIEKMKTNMIIGNPEQVKTQVEELQQAYKADEIMIVTITPDKEATFHSYRLLKEVLD
ncbi:MAG TPA: LLM class flavin-dependent oxidoreductase [Virgibacillus sp.]|nr:LLM class flavin-dependent oxidoreductase [Virgibacillus sp.]